MTNDRIEGSPDPAAFADAATQSPVSPATKQSTAEASAVAALPELWSKPLAWVILVTMAAVLVTSIIHSPAPAQPGDEYFTVCGFKNLTGLPCPGCGLTHSFCEIGKGHLSSAVNWNWLGIPLFLLTIVVGFQALFLVTNRVKPAIALNRLAGRIRPMRLFAIAFALYGLGRILYILIYDPGARASSPITKLYAILTGS